jgi:hypothetical protein
MLIITVDTESKANNIASNGCIFIWDTYKSFTPLAGDIGL